MKDLLENISGARIFLIFTYRPEFVPTWGGKSYYNQVTLNRLSNRESLAMVAYLLRTADIDKGLEELVLEKTEGVPFFIEEFIKSLLEQKIIDKHRERYCLENDIEGMSVPSTVQDVLMARIDSLSESAKDVFQTGSVVGREFNQDLIQSVTGLSERELLSDLSVLKDSEFLYERGIYPRSSYIFIHALTQEVAYNSLMLKRRKEIHEAIGKAIESLQTQRLDEFYEILAYHYSRGDNFEKAYQYLKLSGNKTTRNYSNWEAFRFYKDAIEVLNQLSDSRDNKRKQTGKFRETSDFAPMVIDLLEKAHKKSDLFGAPFNAYSLLCAYYALSLAMLGNFEKATDYLKKGLCAASSIHHLASLAVLETMFGLVFIIKGDGKNAIMHFKNSIRYFEESKTVLIFAVSWSVLGSGYYYLRELEAARKHIAKGIDLTNRGGSEWWKSFHYLYLSKTHFDLGDQKRSQSSIEEALKISQKNSEKHVEGASWAFLGRILGKTALSQSDMAAEYILKGINILDDLKIKPWCAEGYLYLGERYASTGNKEGALNNLRKAESMFQEMGMDYYLSTTQEILSRL